MPVKHHVPLTAPPPPHRSCWAPCRGCSPRHSAGHKMLLGVSPRDRERATSMEKGQPSLRAGVWWLRCPGTGQGGPRAPPKSCLQRTPPAQCPFCSPDQSLQTSWPSSLCKKPPSPSPSARPQASQRKTTAGLGQSPGQGDSKAPPCKGHHPFAAVPLQSTGTAAGDGREAAFQVCMEAQGISPEMKLGKEIQSAPPPFPRERILHRALPF